MPNFRRKRVFDTSSQAIGGNDVLRLQNLLKLNAEECNVAKQSKYTDGDSDVSSLDEEIPAFDNSLPTSKVPDMHDKEWSKFFYGSKADEDLVVHLQKKLSEAKDTVTEELSQYAGNAQGELDYFDVSIETDELPEEVQNHLRLLTDVLKHYRSGPLPKTVKMLPHLPGWEELLEMLQPLEWTPQTYPRVVKVFASKGREPALHFYERCLLPKVKQDIQDNRRLSVHMFEALISSMFRAEEFVSGVFLPWVQSDMSKTEGIILAHLIKKATLKSRYAAVALALCLEEEFSIPRSLIIEAFFSKNYFMPEPALKRAVEYFLSFDKDCSVYHTNEGRLPVTWFRSLLLFLEAYRSILGDTERTQLLKLCRRHEHPKLTSDLRTLLTLTEIIGPSMNSVNSV